MSALLEFVEAETDIEALLEILALSVDPNESADDGRTALHLLASKTSRNRQDADNVLEMARILITFGADVNARNNAKRTPLIEAVRADNSRMVELLLKEKAKVNQPDDDGNTPLHHAVVSFNSVERERNNVRYIRKHIVKALVRYGCNLDMLNNMHQSPLMWAVAKQDYLIVKELLRQNASVIARDNLSNSLMHYALDQEEVNEDIVLELVRHGCLFSDKNQDNETAMTVYIRKLKGASDDKLKAAKYVFKLFLFLGYVFEDEEKKILYNIGEAEKGKLPNYCQSCRCEVLHMLKCKIGLGFDIYDVTACSLSYRNVEDLHIPDNDFDKVLQKLFKGEFPLYCDFIVSGIRLPYLRSRFPETCCSVGSADREFLSVDVLCLLSSYLSGFDLFNMMAACSVTKSCCGFLLDTCRKCFIWYRYWIFNQISNLGFFNEYN